MIHPSTKKLIEKLGDLTRQRRIDWVEADEGILAYETEGYRIEIRSAPHFIYLRDSGGKLLEEVTPEEQNDELTVDGRPYTKMVYELYREAARQARGTDAAIDRVLAELDLGGDGMPDSPSLALVPEAEVDRPGDDEGIDGDALEGAVEDPVEETQVAREVAPIVEPVVSVTPADAVSQPVTGMGWGNALAAEGPTDGPEGGPDMHGEPATEEVSPQAGPAHAGDIDETAPGIDPTPAAVTADAGTNWTGQPVMPDVPAADDTAGQAAAGLSEPDLEPPSDDIPVEAPIGAPLGANEPHAEIQPQSEPAFGTGVAVAGLGFAGGALGAQLGAAADEAAAQPDADASGEPGAMTDSEMPGDSAGTPGPEAAAPGETLSETAGTAMADAAEEAASATDAFTASASDVLSTSLESGAGIAGDMLEGAPALAGDVAEDASAVVEAGLDAGVEAAGDLSDMPGEAGHALAEAAIPDEVGAETGDAAAVEPGSTGTADPMPSDFTPFGMTAPLAGSGAASGDLPEAGAGDDAAPVPVAGVVGEPQEAPPAGAPAAPPTSMPAAGFGLGVLGGAGYGAIRESAPEAFASPEGEAVADTGESVTVKTRAFIDATDDVIADLPFAEAMPDPALVDMPEAEADSLADSASDLADEAGDSVEASAPERANETLSAAIGAGEGVLDEAGNATLSAGETVAEAGEPVADTAGTVMGGVFGAARSGLGAAGDAAREAAGDVSAALGGGPSDNDACDDDDEEDDGEAPAPKPATRFNPWN